MNIIKSLLNRIKWLFSNRIRTIVIIIFLLALGFGGWKVFGNKNQQTQYQTAKVERSTIISSVSASGQLITSGIMPITTQASGIVKTVFVKSGDSVVAGQNLIEITPDQQGQQKQAQAWASYLSAKTSLESAKAQQFSLQSSMFTKWKAYMDAAQSSSYQNPDGSPRTDTRQLPQFYSTLDDWLAAEAQYKNQQAVVTQAQASLNSSWESYQSATPIVTAPIAGTVNDITVLPGMTFNSQTTGQTSTNNTSYGQVATIKNESNPIGQFNLSEVDVINVKPDQKATITIDALPDKTFTGTVAGLNTTGVVSSGVTNYPVTIQFDTPLTSALPNMSATANIIINTKDNVLLVPSAAIQTTNGQATVRVLQNNQVQQKTVEVGLTSESQTEIVSGLTEGETVVTSTITNNQSTSTSPFGSNRGGIGGIRPGGFGGSR
ncbi:MAG: efflux RND transporter periplasmic adaptor subunit [Patescibacteria group bacterium]|nr:efflux RND transporter periplasmic adaptor subunit [Patescibacteria group bacterium]